MRRPPMSPPRLPRPVRVGRRACSSLLRALRLSLIATGSGGRIARTRVLSLALVALLVLPTLPVWDFLTPSPQASHAGAAAPAVLSPGPPVQTPAYTGKPSPSLAIRIRVAPDSVTVGTPATITLTVRNDGAIPATNLVVTLPTPVGVDPQAGPGLVSATAGWRWSQPQLAAHSDATFTAIVLASVVPPSRALLLAPTVTSQEITTPVTGRGGAVIEDVATAVVTTQAVAARTDAALRSADARVDVALPAAASTDALTVRYTTTPGPGEAKPAAPPTLRRVLGVFYLNATNSTGQAVHQLAAPYTLTVHYTPEQLAALDLNASGLSLFWWEPTVPTPGRGTGLGQWRQLRTQVDTVTHTATASVDHFSTFSLGDPSGVTDAFRPTLQGFQVNSFTGAASYEVPIAVPAGPNGVKPTLTLHYDSNQSDGGVGENPLHQAGWAGRDWSLDTGAISLDLFNLNDPYEYTLVLGGKSYRMFGAAIGTVDPSTNHDPTQRTWSTADESFLKITVEGNGNSTYTNGDLSSRGFFDDPNGNRMFTPLPRYKWHVWTKDGTQYDFEEDLWQGFDNCTRETNFMGGYHDAMTFSWKLTHATDTHGNTITYTYQRDSDQASGSQACGYLQGTADHDAWPTSITWGKNANGPSDDRYRVLFYTSATSGQAGYQSGPHAGRAYDNQFDDPLVQIQYGYPPHPVVQLNYLDVQSKPDNGDFGLITRYQLNYTTADAAMLSDHSNSDNTPDTTDKRLTLHNVCHYGNNGDATPTPMGYNGSPLPCTVFSYGNDRGTGTYPNGDWNRLNKVENGYTGTVTIAYDDIGAVVQNDAFYQGTNYVTNKDFANYRRVTSRILDDGRSTANSQAQWRYSYGRPELNADDKVINSAELYLDQHYYTPGDPNHDPTFQYDTVAQAHREFRGHASMTETDPKGKQTKHYFYQGDVDDRGEGACPPTVTGNVRAAYDQDTCFARLHLYGILKGREYKTEVTDANGNLQERIEHNFPGSLSAVQFVDMGVAPYTGVWHAWAPEQSTVNSPFEGGSGNAGPPRTTTYSYDSGSQGNTQYGNITSTVEQSGSTTLRRTDTTYAVNTSGNTSSGPYIVNRATQVKVSDGANKIVKLTRQYYDGQGSGVGAKGELTKVSAYADATTPANTSDTAYGYDTWGNKTSTMTYSDYNGGHPRTTTIGYDSKHAHPNQVNYPLGLSESAAYDGVMDTLTSVTDANGQTTVATYDPFGRLLATARPLETNGCQPPVTMMHCSLQATYRDAADATHPPNVTVAQSDATGNRPTTTFFDGRGRTIQTRAESTDNTQTITVDTQYDGVGNVTRTSQARYLPPGPNGTGDPGYALPDPGLYNPTITDYDVFGRATKVTGPGTSATGGAITTQTSFGISGAGRSATATDANNHQTTQATDAFGRLTAVGEVYGGGAPTQTTTYAYTALDQLLSVTDPQMHVTAYAYDDLGRTTSVNDPDLGLTTSSYDAVGNLKQTRDANGKVIAMGYDDLDRMMSKQFDGSPTNYTYDLGTLGKGRLTSESGPNAMTQYTYDARGRKTGMSEVIQGITQAFSMGYDLADNQTSTTYPGGEVVTTGYDAAERPVQAQSSIGGTNYAGSVMYTALGKLMGITLGNGVAETFGYDMQTQRLSQHQIGPSGSPFFNRSYSYDGVGNVTAITGDGASGAQSFSYDERDRLTAATAAAPAAYTESDSYDAIGNLTTKGGVAYSYPAHTTTNRALPHAPATAVGGAYTYDEVGNTLTGNGRTLTWNSQNLPLTITGAITTGGGGGGTPTPTATPPPTLPPTVAPTATGTAAPTGTVPPGTTAPCATTPPGISPNLTNNRGGATVAGNPNLTSNRGGATVAGNPNLTANRGCGTGATGTGLQPRNAPMATTTGTETYTYDAEGARVSRNSLGITTLFFGGLWEVDKETNTTRAFYALGGSTVAQRTRLGGTGDGTLVYLHGDHLGSVSILTDSTGAKLSGEEYGPWGQTRAGDNSSTTPLDFTGQHRDGTGLLYYGARYYDPALGRFLSGDTVGGAMSDPQSWNPYSYVRNNPLNRTDPTGHDPLGNGSYNPDDPNNQIIYPATAPGGYGGYGTPSGGFGGYGGNGCGGLGPNVYGSCAGTFPTPVPATPTGTTAPYCSSGAAYCAPPTATVGGPCGNVAAYCAPATATLPPPTLTPTAQTILTAQGVPIPIGIVRPDGSSPPFDPVTGAPIYGPPPPINPDAYAQPFGQGLQYRNPRPYGNDPAQRGPPGGERLPRYPLDPQGNPITGMPYSYMEYDIYARGQNPLGPTNRGTQRIVINNVTGQGYYTDDHYFIFTPFYP